MTLRELTLRFASQRPAFAEREVKLVEITREPEELRSRIRIRVEQMVRSGLVDEVRALKDEGLESNASAARAIGYREVLAALRSGAVTDALIDQIAANTWRLARKQRTWFRNQLPAHRRIDGGAIDESTIGRLFC